MARRVYGIEVNVPAGTPIAIPVAFPWVTEDEIISDIEVLIPAGHNGFTGVRVRKGDVQILPYSPNTWIIANDYVRVFTLDEYIPTGDLFVEAYNVGGYPHTFHLRMTVSDASKIQVSQPVTESAAIAGLSEETTGNPAATGIPAGAGSANVVGQESVTFSQATSSEPATDITGIENIDVTASTPNP